MCSAAIKTKTWDYEYASFQRKFGCCLWNAACVPKLVKLWRILLLNCLVIELPLLLDILNCAGSRRGKSWSSLGDLLMFLVSPTSQGPGQDSLFFLDLWKISQFCWMQQKPNTDGFDWWSILLYFVTCLCEANCNWTYFKISHAGV